MSKTFKIVAPKPNEKCLCGSNYKFKKCCSAILPNIGEIGANFEKYAKAENYESALLAARADITKYTLCHKGHTEPARLMGLSYADELIDIDTEALSDLVENLCWIYKAVKKESEISKTLERLKENIKTEKWRRKIIVFKTYAELGSDWNIEAGHNEISKLGPIDNIQDPEELSIYLDLVKANLSLDNQLKYLNKILNESEELETLVHQGISKSLLLLLHRDFSGANETLVKTLKRIQSTKETRSTYVKHKCAQGMYLLASLGIKSEDERDKTSALKYVNAAIQQQKELLTTEEFSEIGKASSLKELADCYRLLEKWDIAGEHYSASNSYYHSEISNVFLAECLLMSGKDSKAIELLDGIKTESFESDDEWNDYIIKYAQFAIHLKSKDRLVVARTLFTKKLKLEPLFTEQYSQTHSNVMEALLDENFEKDPDKKNRALALLSKLNSYVVLQPNVMGMGLDINKIIDDFTNKHKNLENDSTVQEENLEAHPPTQTPS